MINEIKELELQFVRLINEAIKKKLTKFIFNHNNKYYYAFFNQESYGWTWLYEEINYIKDTIQ